MVGASRSVRVPDDCRRCRRRTVGVAVVTHCGARASRPLPAPVAGLAAPAAGAGGELVVAGRHRRAGGGDGCRDPDGDPARVQPWADARAGAPAARHLGRGDAHPRRLPAARRLPRAADRAGAPAGWRPSPTAGRSPGQHDSLLERAGREFNYPPASHIRSAADWGRHGSYSRFCSNACAAWSNAALDAIGGFKPTLVSEETIAVAELLARGGRIAYVAEAMVEHAHRLDLAGAFRRQFDIGYSRRLYDWLLLAGEGDGRRGRRFAAAVLRRACRESPRELPRTLAQLAASWLGYRTGLHGHRLPLALARRLSGQDYFWSSEVDGGRRRRPGARLSPRCAWPCSPTTASRRARGSARHMFEVARRLQARGHRVTVLARGRAFARWAEIARRRPAGSPLPALSAAAIPSCAGPHRARRLAARRRRRRRSAPCPPAAAAAAADPAAGGRHVPQPDAARHRRHRRAGAQARADQGQRACCSAAATSNGISTTPTRAGGRVGGRRPRARVRLPPARPATAGGAERRRRRASSPTGRSRREVPPSSMSAGSAIARACSACSRPSRACRPSSARSWSWPAKGRSRARCAGTPPPSGIAGRVRFAGFLDRAGVRAELQDAGCFVNPADYETGPLTLLEAMACGTPVVSTATGLAAEMGAAPPLRLAARRSRRTWRPRSPRRWATPKPRPRGRARPGRWSRRGSTGSMWSTGWRGSTACGRSARHDPAAAGGATRPALRRAVPGLHRRPGPPPALARRRRPGPRSGCLGPRGHAVHRCGGAAAAGALRRGGACRP